MDYISSFPVDITYEIMKKIDTLTAFKIMTTSKTNMLNSKNIVQEKSKNVVTNVLKALVKSIEDYNLTLIHNSDSLARKILSGICNTYTRMDSLSDVDRRFFSKLFTQIMTFTIEKTGLPNDVILGAWIDIINIFSNKEVDERMYACLTAFKEYIFGSERSLHIMFGLPNKDNTNPKYWIFMRLFFSDDKACKLELMVQDLEREIRTYDICTKTSLVKFCPQAYINDLGYIICKISPNTIEQLASHLCNVFGYGIFMTNVSITPRIKINRKVNGIRAVEELDLFEFYTKSIREHQNANVIDVITSSFW
jgi:hypothetical protein